VSGGTLTSGPVIGDSGKRCVEDELGERLGVDAADHRHVDRHAQHRIVEHDAGDDALPASPLVDALEVRGNAS
jgi:hypothetical protein